MFLAQHDVQPVSLAELRWLLDKAIAVFGDRPISELTSQEVAEWRMTRPAIASREPRPSDRF